jgi:hypothetical protein
MIQQTSASFLCHQPPQRFTLFYLKEVLVEIRVALIVESKIAWAVLAQQQFFSRADLVEKLS